MSSPIASQKKTVFDSTLIKIHQKYSHSNRVQLIAKNIFEIILNNIDTKAPLKCVDIGCGDMTLAETLNQYLTNSDWKCLDIYELPENLRNDKKWNKYVKFNGRDIPFENDTFDIAIFSDVLHHIQDEMIYILKEAARVSKYIIIKDHFKYGFLSNLTLKAMDYIGNRGYGVKRPAKYFTRESYMDLISNLNLKEKYLKENIHLYDKNFLFKLLSNPKWQFISLCEKNF